MSVFVSWSMARSQKVAVATRKWLKKMFQGIEVFVSEKDIEAGGRWYEEISNRLEASDFGIICVTAENLGRPWLMFEAGALAKKVDVSRVVPYLYDLDPTQLAASPLASFQAKRADREGTLGLVTTLNKHRGELRLENDTLDETFDLWWQRGWERELQAKAIGKPKGVPPAKPTTEEVLNAIYGQMSDVSGALVELMRGAEIDRKMLVRLEARGEVSNLNRLFGSQMAFFPGGLTVTPPTNSGDIASMLGQLNAGPQDAPPNADAAPKGVNAAVALLAGKHPNQRRTPKKDRR